MNRKETDMGTKSVIHFDKDRSDFVKLVVRDCAASVSFMTESDLSALRGFSIARVCSTGMILLQTTDSSTYSFNFGACGN